MLLPSHGSEGVTFRRCWFVKPTHFYRFVSSFKGLTIQLLMAACKKITNQPSKRQQKNTKKPPTTLPPFQNPKIWNHCVATSTEGKIYLLTCLYWRLQQLRGHLTLKVIPKDSQGNLLKLVKLLWQLVSYILKKNKNLLNDKSTSVFSQFGFNFFFNWALVDQTTHKSYLRICTDLF